MQTKTWWLTSLTLLLVGVSFSARLLLAGPGTASANGVQMVSPGTHHTCAVTGAGGVRCWGANSYGQLGNGTFQSSLVPVDVGGLPNDMLAVVVGERHSCAMASSGGVWCWGDDTHMQLGTAPETTCQPGPLAGNGAGVGPATLPTPHPEPCANTPQRLFGITAVDIDAEGDQTCVVIDDGTVRCWGAYDPVTGTAPAQVDGIDSRVVAVDVGYGHACALTDQGGVLCWGNNYRGQLGDGNGGEFGDYSRTAVAASGIGSGVRAITAGGGHSCALLIGGAVKCWGVFLVGDGSRLDRTTPVDISNAGDGVATLTAGASHICALLKSGALNCWGSNIDGALGLDTAQTREVESPIAGPDLTSPLNIYAGGFETCAVLKRGALQCWGRNNTGQLGDGSTDSRYVPAGVSGFDAKPLPTATPPQAGDANCDGLISAIDGALILQFEAALLPALPCPDAADASGDGRVDARDALLVLQRIAGLAA